MARLAQATIVGQAFVPDEFEDNTRIVRHCCLTYEKPKIDERNSLRDL